MKLLVNALFACGLVAGLQQVAQAQIAYSSSTGTAAWNGVPIYTSLANANLGGLSAQGDPTITGANGVLAETFTPSSAFTLSSFNIMMGVGTAGTYGVDIVDLGPAGTVSVSSPSASYTPASLVLNDTVNLTGSGGGQVQGMFALSGLDQVKLAANEEYALEILTPSALGQNSFIWYRSGTADPGGQMFSGGDSTGVRNTLEGNGQAGGAPRTGALALYAVPEPSSIALFGLGAAALVLRRRKN